MQAICDRLGPGTINVFVQRWLHRLPMPLGPKDHDAGYWWETSMRQVEISRTIVFDAPRHARGFFEALVADNLNIGRPHNVEIIFARKIRRDTKGLAVQKLPPGRVGVPLWCRRDLQRPEDPADRGRADAVAELQKFALDPLVSPAVILSGEPLDQRGDLCADRRPSHPLRVRRRDGR